MGEFDTYCAICGSRAAEPHLGPAHSDNGDGNEGDGYGTDEQEDEEEFEIDATKLWGSDRDSIDKAEEDGSYVEKFVTTDKTRWMGDVVLFGWNPFSPNLRKVFKSGHASEFMCGSYMVQPSNDSAFPAQDILEDDPYNGCIDTYFALGKDILAVPIHRTCLEGLLEGFLWWMKTTLEKNDSRAQNTQKSGLDHEILWHTLKNFGNCELQQSPQCLNIEYGQDCDENHNQYWEVHRGTEYLNRNPHDIPALRRLYRSLPTIFPLERKLEERSYYVGENLANNGADFFDAFPAELRLHILSCLSMKSIWHLRCASPAARRTKISPAFWRDVVFRDMPFLYDLPSSMLYGTEVEIDWEQAYWFLDSKSRNKDDDNFLGLVNRRRAWRPCEQLLRLYMKLEENQALLKFSNDYDLDTDIESPRIFMVKFPQSRQPQAFKKLALSKWPQIGEEHLHLKFFWGHNGILLFIEISTSLSQVNLPMQAFTYDENADLSSDLVTIPKNDWLDSMELIIEHRENLMGVTGIVLKTLKGLSFPLRTSTGGNHRFISVTKGTLFVGLIGEIDSDGVSQLGLLEAKPPNAELVDESLFRLAATKQAVHANFMSQLWKDKLPPREIIPEDYGNDSRVDIKLPRDLRAMQVLLFGTGLNDIATLTKISGDTKLGGFSVTHMFGSVVRIGNHHTAVKEFDVSGSSGEKIVDIVVHVMFNVCSVALRTNFGRQIAFGPKPPWRSLAGVREEHLLAGMYCYWEAGVLKTCAALYVPLGDVDQVSSNEYLGHLYEYGYFWEPEKPPEDWVSKPPIFGLNQQNEKMEIRGLRNMSTKCKVACWLSFEKPIQQLSLFVSKTISPSQDASIQIVSLIADYSDGSRVATGPVCFEDDAIVESDFISPINDSADAAVRTASSDWPLGKRYCRQAWDIGGEQIQYMFIWAKTYLEGFQFLTFNKTYSPRFGVCSGPADGCIAFGASELPESEATTIVSKCTSVKFLLGPDEGEIVVLGLQGMAKAS